MRISCDWNFKFGIKSNTYIIWLNAVIFVHRTRVVSSQNKFPTSVREFVMSMERKSIYAMF